MLYHGDHLYRVFANGQLAAGDSIRFVHPYFTFDRGRTVLRHKLITAEIVAESNTDFNARQVYVLRLTDGSALVVKKASLEALNVFKRYTTTKNIEGE